MAVPRPSVVDVLAALLALACPAVLFVVVGPVAGLAGGLAFLAWLFAPVYGFALGQFGLLVAVPGAAISPRFAVAQEALFVLLVLGLVRHRQSALGVLALVVLALALVTAVLVGIARGVGTLPLAGGLVGVVALASYLLHRYELVAMGLVADEA